MDSIKVVAPYDLSLIQELPYNSSADVDSALEQAAKLEKSGPLPKYKRIEILGKTIALLKPRREELARAAALEGGKPYLDSLVEVDRGLQGIQNAIEGLAHLAGTEIPMGLTPASKARLAFTTREPIGVVVAVSAFNHPFNLIVHQVIPAIATGCPIIVKPAQTTPLSCVELVNTLYEAGLPKEWCRVLITSREDSEKLVTDSRVRFFSFIGSPKVGWSLRSKLAPGARCALEHGGAAPVIVEKDADLAQLLPAITKGGFYHAGQVCVSVQRVYVQESIFESVANSLAELANKLVVGDPTEKNTEVGPLILPRENDRIATWVEEAKAEGAKVICGGEKISDTCYRPTVLLNPKDISKVSQLEIFGPVVCLYSYKDRHDAVERANNVPFSFQAAVFTQDINTAFDTVKKLNASTVMVNDHTAFRVDWMPFAGHRTSGLGIGGIPYTMHDMTQEKQIVIHSESKGS